METEGGGDVALWQRMEGAGIPAQMEVKLSEFLALAGRGVGWKHNLPTHYPLLHSEGSDKWTQGGTGGGGASKKKNILFVITRNRDCWN